MGPSEVLTTGAFPDSGFDYHSNFNGTSAATPNVSGVASLVWSANPDLTASEVKEILSETAYDLGTEGYDIEYGHGFVNADAAVRRAIALSDADSLTGNAQDNLVISEEDALFAHQVANASEVELGEYASINLGATESNDLMALQDFFGEDFSYSYDSGLSSNLGEDSLFYNVVEV